MAEIGAKETFHTVTTDQTFYAISRQFQKEFPGITPEKIMADNGYDDPRTLAEGTKLKITLAEIAKEVDAPVVAEQPAQVAPASLGQKVLDQVRAATAELEKPVPKAIPVAPVASPSEKTSEKTSEQTGGTFDYKVPAGSNLWKISAKFDQPIADIAAANGLKEDGSDLRADATIKVTPGPNSKHEVGEITVQVASLADKAVEGLDFNRGTKGSLHLTFDDGPNSEVITFEGKKQTITEHILDKLDEYGAKAVFFVNGTHLQSAEGERLAKEISDRGHELAPHSMYHADLQHLGLTELRKMEKDTHVKANPDTWKTDYAVWTHTKTAGMIEDITGQKPDMSRAAYGSITQDQRDALAEAGIPHEGWKNDSNDWKMYSSKFKQTAETTQANVLNGDLSAGSVILFHEKSKTLTEVLDPVLKELSARGHSFDAMPNKGSGETQLAAEQAPTRG